MSRRPAALLIADILERIQRIERSVAGLDHVAFLHDEKTIDSVVRNLEVIGEAASRLSQQFRDRHPEIPWRRLRAIDRMNFWIEKERPALDAVVRRADAVFVDDEEILQRTGREAFPMQWMCSTGGDRGWWWSSAASTARGLPTVRPSHSPHLCRCESPSTRQRPEVLSREDSLGGSIALAAPAARLFGRRCRCRPRWQASWWRGVGADALARITPVGVAPRWRIPRALTARR